MSKTFSFLHDFAKRHKKKLIALIVLLCVVMVCAISPHFVSVRFDHFDEANAIFSIAFDRWQMNRVDRVELISPDGIIVIQDSALARDIVNATMVATHSGQASFGGHYIHLYRGNRRVRRMQYNGLSIIEVSRLGAQVNLPPDLETRLRQYRANYMYAALEERVAHRRPLADAITVSYPQQELLSNLRSGFGGTLLRSLDTSFPIEVLRTFDGVPLPYVVYRLEEGGYAFLFFHEEHYRLDYVFVIKEPLTRECFDGIKRGSRFADVEAVDPGFRVLNSITDYAALGGRWSQERASTHMVREGFVQIQYGHVYGHVYEHTGRDINTDELRVTSVRFIPNGEHLRFFEHDFPR